MVYYFAYGSNIDRFRMIERIGPLKMEGVAAILKEYRLCFDKVPDKVLGYDYTGLEAFANIHQTPGDQVEGIVYELSNNQISALDKWEGHPHHYRRKSLNVEVEGRQIQAETYIANEERTNPGRLPKADYLNHLLVCRELFSDSYLNLLDNWQTVEMFSSNKLEPVFVYGTLKRGQERHAIAGLDRYLGQEALCHRLDLHKGPDFPFAVDGKGKAHGEYYELSTNILAKLDMIEGHPDFFRRVLRSVLVDGVKNQLAWVYICDDGLNYPLIGNGVWSP